MPASFLFALVPEIVSLLEKLFDGSGGDIDKAKVMIAETAKHYRKEQLGLESRVKRLEDERG